jgi:hypothetical protein
MGKKVDLSDKKTCHITVCYKRMTWVMKVDGEEIEFKGATCAEYFRQHYTDLGYVVTVPLPKAEDIKMGWR